MAGVKRVEANGLVADLKAFAFEGNDDFRNDLVMGVDIEKTFHHPVEPITDECGEIFQAYRRTTLSFSAHRLREKQRSRPAYVFNLAATAERSIHFIPPHIFNNLDEDTQEQLSEIDEDGLAESYTTTFNTWSYDLGEIESTKRYAMTYWGEPFVDSDDVDVVYDNENTMIDVPEIETDDHSGMLFVPDEVMHEQLATPADRLINELAFRAIIDPFFNMDDPQAQAVTFRETAARMRAIMDGLRHGVRIDRLHDI